jgi:hypothetical protein
MLEKVAKKVAKPKNAKIFSTKLNWKVQNIFTLFLLISFNTFNKQYLPLKSCQGLKKSSPNGEISPNLVTLETRHRIPNTTFSS